MTEELLLVSACQGLVRALDLLGEIYPQPGGRPIHLAASLDNGITLAVDVDEETVAFLASRAAASAARGQVRRRRNAMRLVGGERK